MSGVDRLTLLAAGVLEQVFTPPGSGAISVVTAITIGPLHQEVALRWATRRGITELIQCHGEVIRLLVAAPGWPSGRRYRVVLALALFDHR